MFLQPVQRLPLIQNLVELEREAADNDVVMALMLANQLNRRQRRRMKRYWVKPLLEGRPLLGHYARLMAELREEDVYIFRKFVRMDPEMFRELLRLSPSLTKKDTRYRKALNPSLKLAITPATWQQEIAKGG